MRIDSSGNVGIGTSDPSDLTGGTNMLLIKRSDTANNYPTVYSASAGNAGWRMKNNDGDWVIIANDALRFYDIENSSEAMRIDSSGHAIIPAGVTLGTAAGVYAAANTLDDYEEGTFTANYSATGLTVTHDITTGEYTKVGNLVTFYILVGTDAVSGTGAVQLSITGLPFTPASGVLPSGSIGLAYSFAANENNMKWTITSGGNLNLWDGDSNTAGVFPSNKLATGTNANRLNIIGHYYTA